MNTSWITTSVGAVAMVIVSALGIYLAVILFTRVVGLRSFAKMSSFDFAMTVAVGSLMATTLVMPDPPLLQAVVGLAALYGIQMVVALLRVRFPGSRVLVDNSPVLLMRGEEMLHENLRRTRVTQGDLRAKLREANVLRLSEVRAVILETTGDISVLHGDPDGPRLGPELLEEVVGGERVRTSGSTDPV